jgi:hypothetical protein
MEIKDTPAWPCSLCGRMNDSAVCASDPSETPQPGHFTICLNCGAVMVFKEDLTTRAITAEERAAWPTWFAMEIDRAIKAIHRLRQQS